MLLMLAASGFGGALSLQAISIWIAVLWPRRAEFSKAFGNRLSPAGGGALCGGIGVVFGLPFALYALGPDVVLRSWLPWLLFGAGSLAFYVFTYAVAPRVFTARRETMMAVIEPAQGGGWLIG